MTVVTLFRSGGPVTKDHIRVLSRKVAQNLRNYASLAVLSDLSDLDGENLRAVPLRHLDWLPVWSKVELFRPIFPEDERLLYLDPTTLVMGQLREIAGARPTFVWEKGVMLWTAGDLFDVYRSFVRNPIAATREHAFSDWLKLKAPRAASWEVTLPGHVVDFSVCQDGYPAGSRLVSFEEFAAPWTLEDRWVRDYFAA